VTLSPRASLDADGRPLPQRPAIATRRVRADLILLTDSTVKTYFPDFSHWSGEIDWSTAARYFMASIFKASESDIEINGISPTGYPMRMLKGSPAIGSGIRPNCEAYGYLLDANGKCAYVTAYNREVAAHPDEKRIKVLDKTCLCTHMRNFDIWTCGHYTYRLKDTTRRLPDGSYRVLSAEQVFHDYQFSVDQKIALPP